MTNESLISIPADLSEPSELRNFLVHLVEELDVVLGNRGDSKSLPEQVAQLVETLAEQSEQIEELQTTDKELSEAVEESFDRILEIAWLKAFALSFTGRNTNGLVTMSQDYNIATGNRVAIGIYEFTLIQTSFSGSNILDNITGATSHTFTPNVTTELFAVDIQTAGLASDTFRILIYEVVQGAGNKLDILPYDPVTVGDLALISGLLNKPGAIPPP